MGIGLNYKIHRLGGLEIAKNIEQKLHDGPKFEYSAMLGGTFPTAIGRVYDQQAAVCLDSCTLPSDGMSPSDLWFGGDKHIIKNAFCYDDNGNVVPLKGAGLGVTIDTEKIRKLIIDNPQDQFRRLRMNKDAPRLGVTLNDGCSYAAEYERLTGRKPNWNLS
jgi:L-alanine-DL-glutamate epimerase-like enolase superfamily enzyme